MLQVTSMAGPDGSVFLQRVAYMLCTTGMIHKWLWFVSKDNLFSLTEEHQTVICKENANCRPKTPVKVQPTFQRAEDNDYKA